MAMGKSLYEEGQPIFYGQNKFHLAPGPIPITSQYFLDLQDKHRNKIRKIVLTNTAADLTREGFQWVENEFQYRISDEETRVKIHV